ncbi:hypothetical protein Taro_011088 [Colocasia esculenta]|uniref:Uncharacterized protein n=1 Tax=Colocasia esculenta TaxID=4460 RepID=A0A843U0N9_COLES|nr:hypothetical protein [Colocasia esculenta]
MSATRAAPLVAIHNNNVKTKEGSGIVSETRSALEQKKAEEEKLTMEIDYDAPIESDKNSVGIGTKTNDQPIVAEKRLSEEEKQYLETKLRQYQETMSLSPDDLSALEGAAVTSAELGDYSQASSLLEKLTKERPKDSDAFRLLGEVKYELNDYEGSVAAYKNSLPASESLNFEVLRGFTNALLAARRPDEAVQVLLSSREHLRTGNVNVPGEVMGESSNSNKEVEKIDPIQVDLLLGKAYSDWGHISDAVSVYDQLISTYPNDFRGYLAKGIILKENGNVGDAERMFIQYKLVPLAEAVFGLWRELERLFHDML